MEGAGPVPEEVTVALAAAPRGLWHKDLDKLPELVDTSGPTVYGMRDVAAVRQEAGKKLAAVEAAAAGGGHGGRGNRTSAESAWLRLVRTAGTAADKVAAALVMAQGDPVGNGKALDALLDLADGARTAGGKRGAGQALDALRDLFTGAMMPDRKLRRMEQQPVDALLATYHPGHPLRRQYLLGWGFEEALKGRHARLVACLGALSKDPLEWLKNKAMSVAASLLASKPEGERDLLALLINKLGDPGRRAASGAAHHLGEVLAKHPAMKGVVVRDVAHFAFRPRIGLRAVYAAVVFVTQIQLSHRGKDPEVAAQMVQLYFDLFQALLASDPPPPGDAEQGEGGADAAAATPAEAAKAKKVASKQKRGKGGRRPVNTKKGRNKGKAAAPTSDAVSDASMGVDSRLLRALLTGVNRALPYVPADTADELVTRIAPAIFRVSHTSSAGGAVQALTLLFHMLAGRAAASDRFYRAVYALLLRPELPRSAAAAMALSLVFRAMRADVQPKRVAAFAKRLLQVRCFPFPSHRTHARAARGGMTKSSGTLAMARRRRALRPDVCTHSTRDFRPHARAPHCFCGEDRWGGSSASRALTRSPTSQVACTGPAPFACGCLLLLSESMRECPSLWTAVLQPEEGDGLERFTDAPMSEDEDDEERSAPAKRRTPAHAAAAAAPPPSDSEAATGYDMTKRDPEWCGAEKSCMWEISLLVSHHHPSVAAMARALLAGTHVVYDGDPLRDLSMASFLDRWLQKKPKDVRRAEHAAAVGHGDDTVAAGSHPMARKALGAAAQAAGLPQPWDGASFAALEEHEVAPPDLFLHKYFTARQAALKVAKANRTRDARRRRGEDDDSDGGGGDEDDSDDDMGPGARRGAGDGHVDGLEFGSSSDEDDDLDAAMEAAEADEHGPAAGGVSAHEAALAAAWAPDSDDEDDDLGASDSDEDGDPDAAPAFADADEYEDILAAGGVEPEDDDEDGDEEADEEELPVYISDGDNDGGWGSEEEEVPPAKQLRRQSAKKAATPVRAKAATPRGGAGKSTKVTRAAPTVTPRPSKRARR